MTTSQNLCGRLSAIGLRQAQVHAIVDQVSKWVKSSGQEWTVIRLKDIKAYYIAKLADTEWKPTTWCKASDKRLKGPFGSLQFATRKQVVRTMNAVMCYSEFVSSVPTQKQRSKFIGSAQATSDGTTKASARAWATKGNQGVNLFFTASPRRQSKQLQRLEPPKPFMDHLWSPEKRAPLRNGGSVAETDMKWVADNLGSAQVNNDIMFFKALSVPAGFYQYARQIEERDITCAGAGAIAFLQEPGFKLRAIANPYRVYQVLLEPLKRAVFDQIKNLREDCTFDQDKGVRQCREWLNDGKTVHSVDLSDATNHFPLSLQLDFLSVFLDMDDQVTRQSLHLFAHVSRSAWRMPDGSSLTFSRGQPLGLGPSFACFALAHNKILSSLRNKWGGDYRVLGDDVVIVGEDLNTAYREILSTQLKVPVSESKTLSSKKLAEFAGKLITSDGVIATPKWREVSDRSFLDVAKLLGPQCFSLLRPRQRAVVRLISEIPEDLGGLGWNPRGRPLEERVALAMELGMLDEKAGELPYRSLSVARARVRDALAYEHNLVWNQKEPYQTHIPTRDVLSRVVTQAGVSDGLGQLDLLQGDYHAGISQHQGDPRGRTTLEILEQKLARATARHSGYKGPSMSM